MPAYLDELTKRTLPIELEIADETFAAEYYPERISGADLKNIFALQEVMATRDGARVVDAIDDCARFLAHVLASWELRESQKGPVVPITEERLTAMGAYVIGSLIGSFLRGMRLGGASGNGSPVRSSPTRTSRSRKSSRRS